MKFKKFILVINFLFIFSSYSFANLYFEAKDQFGYVKGNLIVYRLEDYEFIPKYEYYINNGTKEIELPIGEYYLKFINEDILPYKEKKLKEFKIEKGKRYKKSVYFKSGVYDLYLLDADGPAKCDVYIYKSKYVSENFEQTLPILTQLYVEKGVKRFKLQPGIYNFAIFYKETFIEKKEVLKNIVISDGRKRIDRVHFKSNSLTLNVIKPTGPIPCHLEVYKYNKEKDKFDRIYDDLYSDFGNFKIKLPDGIYNFKIIRTDLYYFSRDRKKRIIEYNGIKFDNKDVIVKTIFVDFNSGIYPTVTMHGPIEVGDFDTIIEEHEKVKFNITFDQIEFENFDIYINGKFFKNIKKEEYKNSYKLELKFNKPINKVVVKLKLNGIEYKYNVYELELPFKVFPNNRVGNRCPNCLREFPADYIFCPYDGVKLKQNYQ